MSYCIIFSILITFATTLTITFKKRIEETMPISTVCIILIIFLAGLLDNLKIGAILVQILTIIQLIFILITILKKDKNGIKEILGRILTPGLLIYTALFIVNVIINKGRIFEDYDEFNHWAVIIKNMFIYNTYGTNPETIVRFNEYPPFTAIFQYLTNTSGLGLAVLSLIIILVKIIIDRKKDKTKFKSNIKSLIVVCIITAVITSMWYIKVNNAEKRWDFSKYVETQENQKSSSEILKNFVTAVFMRQDITTKKLTVFSVTVLLIGLQIYSIKKIKNKNFNYYAIAMLISIPIYLISLAITYMTIFEKMEGSMLTCFDRYTSTILLATLCFNAFALFDIKTKFSIEFIVIARIIIALMPLDNIHIQYVRGKNYIRTSNTNRDIYTKIENYKDKLTADDKILYMAGDKANMEYLRAMNEYVMMPVRIKNMVSGNYESAEKFEKVIERYDYVFVYRTNQDTIDNIKACFEDGEIERDTLYKVVKNNKTVRLVPEQ